jgi:hypothetical protein
VEVTSNTPMWKLHLTPTLGDALLIARKDGLPNVTATTNILASSLGGGHKVQKLGDEHAAFGSPTGQTNVPPGTYYLAVVSEGQSAGGSTAGSGGCDFELTSQLPADVEDLGVVGGADGDLVRINDLEGGESDAFQFTSPAGAINLTVSLTDFTGTPLLRLRNDGRFPLDLASYGQDGSYKGQWESTNQVSITSPTSGVYQVSVLANGRNTSFPASHYTLRVHAEGAPPRLSFDGGSTTVTAHSNLWKMFVVTVPTNATGWDLRLANVTNGSPRLVVCRDQLPVSLVSRLASGTAWSAYTSTNWPSGAQLAPTTDWTGFNEPDGQSITGRVFQVGMGNPLEPGTYYIGVTNLAATTTPTSYTLVSRGIGEGYLVPVVELPFAGGSASLSLSAREAAWYRVVVPANTPSWKLMAEFTTGDGLLLAQRGSLPNPGALSANLLTTPAGGKKMQKLGAEHLLALTSVAGTVTNYLGGVYYLGVVSEGSYPSNLLARIGAGACELNLWSDGVLPPVNLGTVGVVDLLGQTVLRGGEARTWQFTVPPSVLALEVELEALSGQPAMTLTTGAFPPAATNRYGMEGGVSNQWQSSRLITVPNPPATNFSLTVQASGANLPDASCNLRVRSLPIAALNFDARLNTNGLTHTAESLLQDAARVYYRVEVPALLAGEPVIGWKLSLSALYGSPTMRIRKGALPADTGTGTSAAFARQAVFVPEFLSPGTWYVEVKATGLTDFNLVSQTLDLARPAWGMPVPGQLVTTPGMDPAGPFFGDTGLTTNGLPLPDDQGEDLEQDSFDYYAVDVPPGSLGLLRTELLAISGNPNLYLRTNAPPTLSHTATGTGGPLYNRALTNAVGTEYGNWVSLNGKTELSLTPGKWFLAVHAAGGSTVRYRLRLSTGAITDLPFAGGSVVGQTLAGGDWRYYRVWLSTNMTDRWTVTLSKQQGDVTLYLRDTMPPGQGGWVGDYVDWNIDAKNHGPYPSFSTPGTYTLTVPPVRPANYYYLGVRASSDATFALSSYAGANPIGISAVIPFVGGFVTNQLPPNGVLRYRVDVPADARRWISTNINPVSVRFYLDQGTLPTVTASDHWVSSGANASLNRVLYGSTWPWLPGYSYFLTVTNTSATNQGFSIRLDGRDCATDDSDSDGLRDCWELSWFNSITAYGGTSDPDSDGLNNLLEQQLGTDPTQPTVALLLNPSLAANGAFSFTAVGKVGRTNRVEISTTLLPGSWTTTTNFVQTISVQAIQIAPPATNTPRRFYRLANP